MHVLLPLCGQQLLSCWRQVPWQQLEQDFGTCNGGEMPTQHAANHPGSQSITLQASTGCPNASTGCPPQPAPAAPTPAAPAPAPAAPAPAPAAPPAKSEGVAQSCQTHTQGLGTSVAA